MNDPRPRPIARRGEVWFVAPDTLVGAEIQKQRRMVIVRRNLLAEYGLTTIVVPFTDASDKVVSVIRPLLKASRASGLTIDSIAACEQVRAIDRLRLVNKVGELSSPDFALVLRGLYEILDMSGAY